MSSKAVRRTRTNLTTYVSGKCQSEGVDRGDLRVDVLGQDRGADPPPAIRSTPVESAQNILLLTSDVDVVGIDEAQFFDEGIVDVCRALADSGVRVIAAGLDMDYTGKPFGPMPALMATAEYVTKVHAICVRCGNLAHHSHRLTADEKQVMLGAQDSYEPICRHCFARLRAGKE